MAGSYGFARGVASSYGFARVAGSYGFARVAGSYVRRDVFSLADLPRLVGIALNPRPAAP